MALVDVQRAYFHGPARRKVFVELLPEDYQAGDGHMRRLLQYNLCGTRDAAQNWGRRDFASTLCNLKLTREESRAHLFGKFASRVNMSWPPCTGMTQRCVENDRRWSASSKMMFRKSEIKKQAIGEDVDLEKSGSIQNRVVK